MNQPNDLYIATLQDIREDLRQLNTRLDSGLSEVRAEIARVNGRIDKLMLTTWVIGGSVITALVGSIITLIITLLTRGG